MQSKTLTFLGDIHGGLDRIYFWQNLNEGSNLIQVGDFGIGFGDMVTRCQRLNEVLAAKNNHVYVVRGNHDMPIWFSGADVYNRFSHIHFVKDNTILELNDKKILCIGGGVSIDRVDRVEGKGWWKDEILKFDESLPGILASNDVDVVVTHVFDTGRISPLKEELVAYYAGKDPYLRHDLTKERGVFQQIDIEVKAAAKDTKVRNWFFGHFHQVFRLSDVEDGTGFNYVGLAIGELYELR